MRMDGRTVPMATRSATTELGQQVLVVMGVAGCGKSTLGLELARSLGAPFLEGDEFHPPANVEKMRAGTPLVDEDRIGWLDALGSEIGRLAAEGKSVVASCSALKKKYREQLTAVSKQPILFVFVDGPRAVIAERMAKRQGHYMPLSLLDSQLATLEPPGTEERCIRVSLEKTLDAMLAETLSRLGERG